MPDDTYEGCRRCGGHGANRRGPDGDPYHEECLPREVRVHAE